MSKRKKGASGKSIISARKRAKRGAVDHAEVNTPITSRTENLSISQRAANFLRDEALARQLSSLRYIALELLDAVESLRIPTDDRSENLISLRDEVQKFETHLINATLVRTRGNQLHAARLLGIKHTTLNEKIRRYGISFQRAG